MGSYRQWCATDALEHFGFEAEWVLAGTQTGGLPAPNMPNPCIRSRHVLYYRHLQHWHTQEPLPFENSLPAGQLEQGFNAYIHQYLFLPESELSRKKC